MRPLIVNFAPTGMVPSKDDSPFIPLSPEEIVDDVLQACEVGITIVHLHARDEFGRPTYSSDVYAKIIEGIRQFDSEVVICVSLSGRNFPEVEQRAEVLRLDGHVKPDMGSLTLSSLNFVKQASENSPEVIQELCARMNDRAIIPELEAFDSGMINYSKYLMRKGLLKPPYYFNLILGNIASAQADLAHVALLLSQLPSECHWSLGGIGSAQFFMNSLAIATGGGVRVGLEDNLFFDSQKKELATNGRLVERIHELAELHGRKVMTGLELREHWDMIRERTSV